MAKTVRTPPTTKAANPPTGVGRFASEVSLILGLVLLIFWLVALLSYSQQDAAWTTSGAASGPTLNRVGRLGAWIADVSYFLLGFSVWWCVAVAVRLWLALLAHRLRGDEAAHAIPRRLAFWLGLAMLLYASTLLEWTRLYRLETYLPGHSGGALGYLIGPQGMQWLGFTGSGMVSIALGSIGAALVFGFSWIQIAERIGARLEAAAHWLRATYEQLQDKQLGQRAVRERERDDTLPPLPIAPTTPAATDVAPPLPTPRIPIDPMVPMPLAVAPEPDTDPMPLEPVAAPIVLPRVAPVPLSAPPSAKPKTAPSVPHAPGPKADGHLPEVDLLDAALLRQESVSPETLEMTSRLIEKKLKDFGVQVSVVAVQPGPVVTRYEIEPATGVKGSQIVNLAKDLARSLSLVSIRVVETIPGKNIMALELPNAKRQTIKLTEILGSSVYASAASLLTVGLGKDIVGNPVVADLAKMPHVLVAGTTGSGKSVGINAMILSLLYKAEARDVRLLMIDPKMLEMSFYEGIPHLIAPVVTDMKQAANGLTWCVAEMERRYKLLSKLGVRNLAGYNAKIDEARAREEFIYNPFSLTPEEPEPLDRMPHLVVIIDELADLMMVIGKKIEELIARLAQKARAAGIHLILATQRPSVDVITGLIKANIPTRIAFQVSSKIDSRTILDQMGAEALLGMGDMLYLPSGTGLPIRVHGAFVSDDEVHRVVAYLKSQGEPDYIEGVLEGGTTDDNADAPAAGTGDTGGEKDPMYDQAVEIVLKNRKASISLVQRHLKIGYNRAARMLEEMEKAGMVGALSNNGQREILVPPRPE